MLRTVEERGVRLIRLWFTDVLGQLKSFAITAAGLGELGDAAIGIKVRVHKRPGKAA